MVLSIPSKSISKASQDHKNEKSINYRITNDDGRCPGLISKESFVAGVYKMHFETGKYWDALGETCFYPYVEV